MIFRIPDSCSIISRMIGFRRFCDFKVSVCKKYEWGYDLFGIPLRISAVPADSAFRIPNSAFVSPFVHRLPAAVCDKTKDSCFGKAEYDPEHRAEAEHPVQRIADRVQQHRGGQRQP